MKATVERNGGVDKRICGRTLGFGFGLFFFFYFYRSIEAVAVRSYRRPDNGGILSSLTDEKNQMVQCLREEEEK